MVGSPLPVQVSLEEEITAGKDGEEIGVSGDDLIAGEIRDECKLMTIKISNANREMVYLNCHFVLLKDVFFITQEFHCQGLKSTNVNVKNRHSHLTSPSFPWSSSRATSERTLLLGSKPSDTVTSFRS